MIKLDINDLDHMQDSLSVHIDLLQAKYNQGQLSYTEKEMLWLQLEDLEDLYIRVIFAIKQYKEKE